MFDPIGSDFFGDGVTAKRIAGALRRIGANPVSVQINSPGGDMFEGLAIYNLLLEHPAEVSVKVMGVAASAASVIAMAADRIEMGTGSMMMVHNSWGVVVGNRNDMAEASEIFAKFDASMQSVYAARTGQKPADITALMDAETFMTAEEAVAGGFADEVVSAENPKKAAAALPEAVHAKRIIETCLAKTGVPRSERRRLLREVAGTQDAAGNAMPGAGISQADLSRLLTEAFN